MPTNLLDTLFKLASLGTSGICIFAIFWIGWLLWKSPSRRSAQRELSMRIFMYVCIAIAVISLVTAIFSNSREINDLQNQNTRLQNDLESIKLSYKVEGVVALEGGGDARIVVITPNYPPVTPYNTQGHFQFNTCREANGKLPNLSLSCPGYELTPLDLNEFPPAGEKIHTPLITLNRIPK